jgi:hypothetical protein
MLGPDQNAVKAITCWPWYAISVVSRPSESLCLLSALAERVYPKNLVAFDF